LLDWLLLPTAVAASLQPGAGLQAAVEQAHRCYLAAATQAVTTIVLQGEKKHFYTTWSPCFCRMSIGWALFLTEKSAL
jgi:hypothetical protein